MEEQFKDYKFVDAIAYADGKRCLLTSLKTKQFGTIQSRIVVSPDQQAIGFTFTSIETKLLDSLADELIREYDDRLNSKKAKN